VIELNIIGGENGKKRNNLVDEKEKDIERKTGRMIGIRWEMK
jgi:hypothetical protein